MAFRLCRLAWAALFCGLILFSVRAKAQGAVELTWDPDQTGLVTQYRVFYGTHSGVYTNSVLIGASADVELTGLQEGVTYYFAIQAMDQQGDVSQLSNEATYSVPVLQPVTIQMILSPGQIYLYGSVSPPGYWELDSSPDLQNWTMVDYDTSDSFGYPVDTSQAPQLFFRVIRY